MEVTQVLMFLFSRELSSDINITVDNLRHLPLAFILIRFLLIFSSKGFVRSEAL